MNAETVTVFSARWEIVYPSGGSDADSIGDFLSLAAARNAIAGAVAGWEDDFDATAELRFTITRDEWPAADTQALTG